MYSWAQLRSSWNSTICNGDHSAGRDFSPASQSCLHGDKKRTDFRAVQDFFYQKNIPVECSSAYLFGQENGHNRIILCMEDKGGALDAGDVNVAVKRHVVTLQPLGEKPVDDGQWPIELDQFNEPCNQIAGFIQQPLRINRCLTFLQLRELAGDFETRR